MCYVSFLEQLIRTLDGPLRDDTERSDSDRWACASRMASQRRGKLGSRYASLPNAFSKYIGSYEALNAVDFQACSLVCKSLRRDPDGSDRLPLWAVEWVARNTAPIPLLPQHTGGDGFSGVERAAWHVRRGNEIGLESRRDIQKKSAKGKVESAALFKLGGSPRTRRKTPDILDRRKSSVVGRLGQDWRFASYSGNGSPLRFAYPHGEG